jgi:hypothetical protein
MHSILICSTNDSGNLSRNVPPSQIIVGGATDGGKRMQGVANGIMDFAASANILEERSACSPTAYSLHTEFLLRLAFDHRAEAALNAVSSCHNQA